MGHGSVSCVVGCGVAITTGSIEPKPSKKGAGCADGMIHPWVKMPTT